MLNCKMQFFESLLVYTALLCSLLCSRVFATQIPLGSSITVADNNQWVSSNGGFAIGFFQHSSQYSIGIHFNSSSIPIDMQTVVWVAGAEVVVTNQSSFHLTPNGELQLVDPSNGESGNVAWTSNTADLGVSYASLHDDGNLVLVNSKGANVWQSFNTPSDTLLPGQKFHAPRMLRASKKSSTSSYYSLYMTDSGQLELRYQSSKAYWNSGNPSSENPNAVLNNTGVLQLLDKKSGAIWSVFADDHSDSVSFRFLRLDDDGNLRLYSWDEDLGNWRISWQAVTNQCEVFATCGSHGVCSFNESGSTVCKCTFGLATGTTSSMCLAPYAQSCGTSTSMLAYEQTHLYGIYPSNDTVIITDFQQCKHACLKDPSCTAVTFLNDGSAACSMMKTRYISGYSFPSLLSVSFVKSCSDPMAVLPRTSPPSSNSLSPSPLMSSASQGSYELVVACLIGAAFGTFCVVAVAQIVVGVWFYKRSISRRSNFRTTFPGLASVGFVSFTYPEIKELTGNFMYQIRPDLFKGTLHSNNQTVVVKQIKNSVDEKKFRITVSVIGSIYHKGLAKLEGYCVDQPGQIFLVYEYLKNGTLERCLRDHKARRRVLTWRKRVEICLSVGRAVSYLHTGCREFISHGNLRCENVVLDENLAAKVSEYGIREILGESDSVSYVGGPAEQDVKDFGMVALDLITGTQNTEEECELLYEKWLEGQVASIVDGSTGDNAEVEEAERMLRIGFWCLQGDERLRPSMAEVVKVLEGTLTVDPPPNPFVFRPYPDGYDESEGEIEELNSANSLVL